MTSRDAPARRTPISNEALDALAKYRAALGDTDYRNVIYAARADGFSCSATRARDAWQEAVTVPSAVLEITVKLPGRHPWATDPPYSLLVNEDPYGALLGDPGWIGHIVCWRAEPVPGCPPEYIGSPAVEG